jgi:putative membrane protein
MSGTAGAPIDRAERLRGTVRWVSGAVFVAVALLLFAPRPEGIVGAFDVSALPWVNAGLNGVAFLWLVAGFAAVKTGRVTVHRWCMTAAMATSALFLVSYVVYHLFTPGPARYVGQWRALYLGILVTHVVLAAVILPAAMNTWIRGWTGAVASHRALARPTFAAWVYVSLSGIAVTWMVH